jgi:hypothetical protein
LTTFFSPQPPISEAITALDGDAIMLIKVANNEPLLISEID